MGQRPSSHVLRKRLTVPASAAGVRLDAFLASRLTAVSRHAIQRAIREGKVLVGGRPSRPSFRLKGGEDILAEVQIPSAVVARPEAMALSVVYEDEEVLVVDKPAGLVVHPSPATRGPTLADGLLAYDPAFARLQDPLRPGIVHRLDKNTSGLMVVAKTQAARDALVEQMRARAIGREYWALVWGVVRREQGTIDAPIGRHPKHRKRMAPLESGRPAVTHYQVQEQLGPATLLRCLLETGRTHQIRVHLAHIGHPVVGDPVYGPRAGKEQLAKDERLRALVAGLGGQALHAVSLAFRHPSAERVLAFASQVRAGFAALLDYLRSVGSAA